MRAVRRSLQRIFGLETFRPGQEEVIRSVMDGHDTLAIMPTGAGKSLCYQLPALHLPGLTLVISPLIALMKDQIDKLQQLGLEASQVNSAQSTRETEDAIEAIGLARPEFVLTTPERVSQPEFIETLRGATLDLIVVDEAHCISEWGHDFRPAYLALGRAIARLGHPPVLALTATATAQVIDDIRRQLDLPDLHVVNTGLYRPNLFYEVRPVADETAREAAVARLLADLPGIGIIYTSTIRQVQTVTDLLTRLGVPVARYHGQLGARERRETQERFMRGDLKAIVATNAFGMGIDKPDIRFVVHYSMPGTIEAYYQESGRAGRDGEDARCVLLYHPSDKRTHIFFMSRKYPRFADVTTVYTTLASLSGAGTAATPAAIHESAPAVSVKRARVVLSLMEDMGLVTARPDGSYRLLTRAAGEQTLEAITQRYDARQAHDRAKLDRMIAYAQSALCRWKLLLDAFGDEPEWTACGHCDNCQHRSEVASGSPPDLPLSPEQPEGPEPGAVRWRVGDEVQVPNLGAAEVRSVADEHVEVAFPDGTVRKFKPEFLERPATES